MMTEYISRHFGLSNIEHFYCGEEQEAKYFSQLLVEFCQEEDLAADFQMKLDRCSGESGEKQADFDSIRISTFLDAFYETDLDGIGDRITGQLSPKVLDNASRTDLLRFISGAYRRIGEDKGEPRFFGANNCPRLCVIRVALQKLGCTLFKTYKTQDDIIPCTTVLEFVPTAQISKFLRLKGGRPKRLDKDYEPFNF
jgi:hypothetical protein